MTFNAALGDAVYKTPEVGGQNSHSFLEWRVKRDLEGDAYFIGLRMMPDTYVGPRLPNRDPSRCTGPGQCPGPVAFRTLSCRVYFATRKKKANAEVNSGSLF